MIWLDGLDLPNFVHYPVHFVEHYKAPRYPAEDVDTSASPIVFPWSRIKAALDGTEGHWAMQPYVKVGGKDGKLQFERLTSRMLTVIVSLTLGGLAERLDAGKSSPVVLETASSVYHVIEGSGHTVINGKRYTWKKGDTFCVPTWHRYQHFADKEETVYLYRFDDKPMLKALGFYRVEGQSGNSLVTPQ
jgi:gentisate 1,2-dioxygenase